MKLNDQILHKRPRFITIIQNLYKYLQLHRIKFDPKIKQTLKRLLYKIII